MLSWKSPDDLDAVRVAFVSHDSKIKDSQVHQEEMRGHDPSQQLRGCLPHFLVLALHSLFQRNHISLHSSFKIIDGTLKVG